MDTLSRDLVPTAADHVVDGLLRHGVDTVFGIPGVQTYELFDSLARAGDRVRVIGARHEQAAGYMAFGYAQATGRTGVFTVVPGPGVLNAGAALLTAYGASTPVVCLTGEIPSDFLGRGLGHVHEMPDQLATLKTLTKWSTLLSHPSEVPEAVATAFHQARVGRPRPVSVAVPWDSLGLRGPAAVVDPLPVHAPVVDPAAVAEAVARLAGASRPLILVGGGARHAGAEVRALAQHLQAPVVSLRSGRGVVSDADPLGFSCAAGFEVWAETDVVIGIGTRMELAWFRWPDRPAGLRTILIDIDPAQATRLAPYLNPEGAAGALTALVADAAEASTALTEALRADGPPRADRTTEFTALKTRVAAQIRDLGPEWEFLEAIRAVLPPEGLFVEEVCQAGFAAEFAFPVYAPRTFLTCGHQGTLGFGYPTALGAQAADPDRAVVTVAGDGGFSFALQEIATAVQYGLNVVAVVFDNNAYGNVQLDQQRLFNGRILGTTLVNPDFARLADTFGALGLTAHTPTELGQALDKALNAHRPTVIHVPTPLGQGTSPWKYLMPASRAAG
ncbi:MAG TPA: thiamine pyrophosphate-dependent enzyme [Pseudonocardia sp.]|nr:thiamine pyrophosphate-dependent enzyme [Pseudonocardia sp.]